MKTKLKKKSHLLMLGFSMILILLISCKTNSNQKTGSRKTLDVATVISGNIDVAEQYPAIMHGKQDIEVWPMMEGYLDSIYVKEGDNVKKGQLLFHIYSPDYEANVRSAQAAVNNAILDVKKAEALVESKIISQYQLDAAKLTLEQDEAALATAKAQVSYAYVKSPVAGVMGNIPYKKGALVSTSGSDPLTNISQDDYMYAYFSINEKAVLDLLGKDKEAELSTVLAKQHAGLTLANGIQYGTKGDIELENGLINSSTGSLSLKAIFPNENHLLRSGSSAVISIVKSLHHVVVIPQSYTMDVLNKTLVFFVDSNGKVKSVPIEIEDANDGKFYIVTKGLKAGDQVVANGISGLTDGDVITVEKTDYSELLTQN